MGRKLQGSVDRHMVNGVWSGKFRARLGELYLGLFDNETDAWRDVNAALQLREGNEPDLLSVWGPKWLDEREEAGHVRDIDNERSIWKWHIATAFFYNWPLKRVRPKHIQKWLAGLTRKEAVSPRRKGKDGVEYKPLGRKISAETIGHARRVLYACFAQARIEGKISQNPVEGVPVPKIHRVVEDEDWWTYLTPDEIKRLFAILPTAKLRAWFAIAIYVGLRDGEIIGVRWTDLTLDGERPELRVRRSRNRGPKTKKSRRNVPLLDQPLKYLREWKQESAALRLKHPKRVVSTLVFPSNHGGCYSRGYDANWDDRKERPVRRVPGKERRTERDPSAAVEVTPGWRTKAKIRDYVRFHDLRHTCASHLRMGTWTPRPLELHEIRDWLGHENIKTTERYAHLAPHMLHSAVRQLFSGNKNGTGGAGPEIDDD